MAVAPSTIQLTFRKIMPAKASAKAAISAGSSQYSFFPRCRQISTPHQAAQAAAKPAGARWPQALAMGVQLASSR